MGIMKLWNAISILASNLSKLADTVEAINDRLTLEALPMALPAPAQALTPDDTPTVIISNASGEPISKRGRRG